MGDRFSPLDRPRIPPPPGGFAAAVRGARARRRRRAAGVVGTSAVLLVVGFAAYSVPGGRTDSLHAVDDGASAAPSASPTLLPELVAPTSSPGDGLRPRATPSPGGPPVMRTARGPAPRPSRTSPPPAVRAGFSDTATPMSRTVVEFATGECDITNVDGDGHWCERYSGPSRAKVGVPVALSAELCRVGGSPGNARILSTREADLRVYSRDTAATPQWRWSTGRRFAKQALTLTVQPGTCVRWTTRWSTRTDRGGHIAPGTYTIRAEVYAEVSGQAGAMIGVARERALTIEP